MLNRELLLSRPDLSWGEPFMFLATKISYRFQWGYTDENPSALVSYPSNFYIRNEDNRIIRVNVSTMGYTYLSSSNNSASGIDTLNCNVIVDSSGQAIRHYYTFAMEHPITKEIAVSNSIENTFSNALRSYIRFYQFGWDDVSVDPSVTYVDYMPLGTLIKFWIIPSES